MTKRFTIILSIWLLIDVYFFTAVLRLTHNPVIWIAYWFIDTLVAVMLLYGVIRRKTSLLSFMIAPMTLLFVPKLVGSVILLLEDITRLFRGFTGRSIVVSELVILVAVVLLFVMLHGLTKGRHRYKIHKETLYFDDLPESFDGFTLTQISDVHAGSFSDKKGVEKGIALINAQNSDVILFTGDLVNNQASEMDPWISTFSRLKAPLGKFSILGNHDYGDYMHWENELMKENNLNRLKQIHAQIGFDLLLDEFREIKMGTHSIALIGVENWGKGGFHKYGDLNKATAGVPQEDFKLLMSHDPSHWEAVVLGHSKKIQLMLSGHTHGMQFGFELWGFKWSPIKYMYKQWAGLYQQGNRYLYVNRGFGFLGLKGRIGIWPEITVITLKHKNS